MSHRNKHFFFLSDRVASFTQWCLWAAQCGCGAWSLPVIILLKLLGAGNYSVCPQLFLAMVPGDDGGIGLCWGLRVWGNEGM